MTMCPTRIACYKPKATKTYSDYVTLIAFQPQEWLHHSTSMLRYTCMYFACRVSLQLHYFVLYRF